MPGEPVTPQDLADALRPHAEECGCGAVDLLRRWDAQLRDASELIAEQRDAALARATAAEARLTEVIEAAQEIHGSTDEDEAMDAWELLYKALPELERPPRFPKRQTRADDLAARLARQDAELVAARGEAGRLRAIVENAARVGSQWSVERLIAEARAALAGPAPLEKRTVVGMDPGAPGGDRTGIAMTCEHCGKVTTALLSAAAAGRGGR